MSPPIERLPPASDHGCMSSGPLLVRRPIGASRLHELVQRPPHFRCGLAIPILPSRSQGLAISSAATLGEPMKTSRFFLFWSLSALLLPAHSFRSLPVVEEVDGWSECLGNAGCLVGDFACAPSAFAILLRSLTERKR
eukprot:Gb_39999 [translate_table: standard]